MVKPNSETFSEEEGERRREAALKVMLATPHKPHKTPAEPRPRRGNSGQKIVGEN